MSPFRRRIPACFRVLTGSLVTLIYSTLVLAHSAHATQWVQAKVSNPSGGKVFKDPKIGASALGNYPVGTAMTVLGTPRNGFYAIDLKKNWRGSRYLWIAASDIKMKQPSRTVSSTQNSSNWRETTQKNWSITPSLGLSSIQYQQYGVSGYDLALLTAELMVNYRLNSSRFEALLESTYAFLPLSSNSPNTSIQFFNGDLMAGYGLQVGSAQLTLYTGLYSAWMNTNSNRFGYAPFFRPAILPKITWSFSPTVSIFASIRYVPELSPSFNPIELDITGGFQYFILPQHPITATIRSSTLSTGQLTSAGGLKSQTLLISLGYSF